MMPYWDHVCRRPPANPGARGGDSGDGRMLGLEELNPAQREEVCVRPGSLLQYARHLKHSQHSRHLTGSLHANTWFALNGHPFQPRFNSSIDLFGGGAESSATALLSHLLLPWTDGFGSFDRRWRPVWQATHRRYEYFEFRVRITCFHHMSTHREP